MTWLVSHNGKDEKRSDRKRSNRGPVWLILPLPMLMELLSIVGVCDLLGGKVQWPNWSCPLFPCHFFFANFQANHLQHFSIVDSHHSLGIFHSIDTRNSHLQSKVIILVFFNFISIENKFGTRHFLQQECWFCELQY